MFVRRIVGSWELENENPRIFLYRALSLCLWKLGLILGWIFSPFSLALTLLRSFQLAIFCLRLIASYFKEWIVTTSQEKSIMLRLLVVLHKLFRSLRCFFFVGGWKKENFRVGISGESFQRKMVLGCRHVFLFY